MVKSLIVRLLASVGVFFVIAIGLFTLVRLSGDPVSMMLPPDAAGSDRDALVEAIRARLGLNQPFPVQFVRWFGDLLQGNLGYSYANGLPVGQLLADRLGPTLLLMGSALLIGLIIAIPAGIVAAVNRNRLADYSITSVSVLAIAVPSFFLAMLGIYIFAFKLHVLPSSGMHTPGRDDFSDLLTHMILPVGILALAVAAPFIRYTRSGMLEELGKDYIRAVSSKGASQLRVVGHGLRNSLISLVTVVALYIPAFLAGAVVIEQVFSWPGMGQLAITALTGRDYPVIIGFGLYVAILVLLSNLAADILYVLVDPRVRSFR